MGTPYVRATPYVGKAGTTRLITITTAAAQQVLLGTGFTALQLFNIGSGSLVYGDSSIAVNSGHYLFVSAARQWENLPADWSIYLRADSVSTLVSVREGVEGVQ